MNALTPRQVVEALDRYIVGQEQAKRAVAVAIRNRWRRSQLPPEERREVHPKNILMIGPTGVGKTEIARRLAMLLGAPFLKVEATKFTEVGYVGRDVDGMIRDLADAAVADVRARMLAAAADNARRAARERVAALLLERERQDAHLAGGSPPPDAGDDHGPDPDLAGRRARLVEALAAGRLDDAEVWVRVRQRSASQVDVFSNMGYEQLGFDFKGLMDRVAPPRFVDRRMAVPAALDLFEQEEADRLLDEDALVAEALELAQEQGIVFIDEIDKVALPAGEAGAGPDVSRGGVQRDLLPLVEGCAVQTKYGPVRTDHVLFIASGAFHHALPTDLIPELQGRFPIRVSLSPLSREDFARILTEPENALTRQYAALLATEGVTLRITSEGVRRIAEHAHRLNESTTDIGARRLHTIMELLLEEVSFNAPEMSGRTVTVDAGFVDARLTPLLAEGG